MPGADPRAVTPSPAATYRSVAVHWPRLVLGIVLVTVLLSAAATWGPLARATSPVFRSVPAAMAVIGALLAAVVGFGRPTAELQARADGLHRREGRFFRWFARASLLRWDEVTGVDVREEMDGSRSLTLRRAGGTDWKVWERFGTPRAFDGFVDAVTRRLKTPPEADG
jgi:hypothetical protein